MRRRWIVRLALMVKSAVVRAVPAAMVARLSVVETEGG